MINKIYCIVENIYFPSSILIKILQHVAIIYLDIIMDMFHKDVMST